MTRLVAVQCSIASGHVESTVPRRSGNFKECVWDYDYIQKSIHQHDYCDDMCRTEINNLKHLVRLMLQEATVKVEQLELIDDLRRLGVAHLFDKEIERIMNGIYRESCMGVEYWAQTDLHTASLTFRLLRQYGYFVPQDIFKSFLDSETGRFKLSLCEDIKGMLSLYEASYLSTEGETIIEEAMDFSTAYCHKIKSSSKVVADTYLFTLLSHALELPLHWRSQRLEARWFIDMYPKKQGMYNCLLQLAKLDFNMMQSVYQDELKDLSKWWENLGLGKAMDFARDSLVISYMWSASIYWEHGYEFCRKVVTQAVVILTTLDDVYDVYGSLDELELFTSAIERLVTQYGIFSGRDMEAMEELPHYLKLCYSALYNFINESARYSLITKGFDSLITLRNAWTALLRSYLKEARWYHQGHQPTLKEYMSNARISVGVNLVTVHAYIFYPKPVSEAELKYLESDPDILQWAAIIFRISNDLGTSREELKRGDTPKSVQCCMHDTQASQEMAETHLRDLVTKGWKELNKLRYTDTNLSLTTIDIIMDTVRASLSIYQYTNRNGVQDTDTNNLLSKLLHDPIPL
uniref:Uncharacterized protein n=1 Tax=Kalanchoe fedtschenkoi TaxID=63787 RepID=A0A7N1A7L4_KALFE